MISKHLGDILGPDSVTRIIRVFLIIQGSLGEMMGPSHSVVILNIISFSKGKLIIHLVNILTF